MRNALAAGWFAATMALSGCARQSAGVDVELVTTSCTEKSPMEGVTHLWVRVKGLGLGPQERIVPVDANALTLPEVEAGAQRVVEVRGFAGHPHRGGQLVSLARSAPFTVPSSDEGNQKIHLTLFLRRVNEFTPVQSAAQPQACSQMQFARAGHSAAVLADGRVFVAGGFALISSGGSQIRQALSEAEVFNPRTGAFSSAAISLPSARAFHSANVLPSGELLLAGGESYSNDGQSRQALADALVLSAEGSSLRQVPLPTGRARHASAADERGRVVLFGGWDGVAPLESIDVYDSAADSAGQTAVGAAKMGATMAFVPEVGAVLAVGGADAESASAEVRLLRFNGETLASDVLPPLRQARNQAALARLGKGRFLVLGGFEGPLKDVPTASLRTSEVIDVTSASTPQEGPLIRARGEACAVAFAEGQVMVAGGRTTEGIPAARSDDAAEWVVQLGSLAVAPLSSLPHARTAHTCTALPDGTGLILGGVNATEEGQSILSDALIFTPAPLD